MSNEVTPQLKACARRLLACEAAGGTPADATESAAFRVCDKLRARLSKLMGVGGFRSLLSRALALGGAEIPWLRCMRIGPDGSLTGLEQLEIKPDLSALRNGELVLVSELLGLLVTFIGPGLTLGFLREIWPEVDDLNF